MYVYLFRFVLIYVFVCTFESVSSIYGYVYDLPVFVHIHGLPSHPMRCWTHLAAWRNAVATAEECSAAAEAAGLLPAGLGSYSFWEAGAAAVAVVRSGSSATALSSRAPTRRWGRRSEGKLGKQMCGKV